MANLTVFAHHATPQDAKRMRALLKADETEMPRLKVVPLTEAIVEMVKADLGVGLMSRWAVSPYATSGQITARRFTRQGLRERWSAVYRRDAPDPEPLARLAELLRARPPVEQKQDALSSRMTS